MLAIPLKVTIISVACIVITLIGLFFCLRRCSFIHGNDPLYGVTDFDTDFPENYSNRTEEELISWVIWKKNHKKTYDNDKKLNLQKQATFLSNLRYIEAFNANANSRTKFRLGLNKFADLTRDEINKFYIGPSQYWSNILLPLGDLTKFILGGSVKKRLADYKNTSGTVVDQLDCKASSVYAAVANVESYHNLVFTSSSIKLSELQILKCHSDYTKSNKSQQTSNINRPKGHNYIDELSICDGTSNAIDIYKTIERMPSGLSTQANYQNYLNEQHKKEPVCLLESTDNPRVRVDSYGIVNKENITDALFIIGPVTVSVDASLSTFHFYESGFYHDLDCSKSFFNHHMLVVAYNPEEVSDKQDLDSEYIDSKAAQPQSRLARKSWIAKQLNVDKVPKHYVMKNSFGENWGEQGYIRYLIDDQLNNCLPQGIATYPNLYIE